MATNLFTCSRHNYTGMGRPCPDCDRELRQSKVIVNAIRDIIWMARRYADGRRTFGALIFNEAYDILRDKFGDEIELYNKDKNWVDRVLMDDGKFYPYAQDGQYRDGFDCVMGRKYFDKRNKQKKVKNNETNQ